jgi:MFS transporter, DHA1 family, multidrug resistance protein
VARVQNPWRGLPPEVAVLSAVAFSVALGFGIVAPAIPLFAKHFDVSNAEASAVISVFALMRLLFAWPAGRLVNRAGERLVLAAGIGIVAVSSLFAGLSQTYPQLLVLRGLGGAGSAMFTVGATSLLLRVAAPDQRGRSSSAFQAGFLMGGITGPLFGGAVTAWSLRAPFFLYFGTLVLAGSVAMVQLSHARLRAREAAAGTMHAPTPFHVALRKPAYRTALTTAFANGWSVFGLRASVIPLFVNESLHLSPAWTGGGLFVWAVVEGAVLLTAGRLVDVRGRRPYLRAGAALCVVAATLLAFSGNAVPFLLAMGLFGGASALLSTSGSAVVGDVIGGRGGTAVAGYSMSQDAGASSGPLLAGRLSDVFSFRAAFLATAAVSAIALVGSVLMPETKPAPSVAGSPPPPGREPLELSAEPEDA